MSTKHSPDRTSDRSSVGGLLLVLALNLTAPACGDAIFDETAAVKMAIADMTPTETPTRGGVEITITGRNFDPGVSVVVGGQPAIGVVRRDAQTLTFVTPPLPAGAHPVEVRGPTQAAQAPGKLRAFVEHVVFGHRNILVEDRGTDVHDFKAGDFDGDGDPDLVVLRRGMLELRRNDRALGELPVMWRHPRGDERPPGTHRRRGRSGRRWPPGSDHLGDRPRRQSLDGRFAARVHAYERRGRRDRG